MDPIIEPFKGPFIKIKRARKHVTELERVVSGYWESRPVTQIMGTVIKNDSGGYSLPFEMEVKPFPEETGAIVGDILHNLRAALDLMACDLCRLNKQPIENVYFPFCETADELDGMIKRRHFDRTGDAAIALIKELKPYKGGNVALRTIHDLDVQDKHRTLIPIMNQMTMPIIKVKDETGARLVDDEGNATPVGDWGDIDDNSAVKIFFPDYTGLAGRELLPTLHNLVKMTAGIIESFEALRGPVGETPVVRNGG